MTTLVSSFLVGSSSYLQETRPTIKAFQHSLTTEEPAEGYVIGNLALLIWLKRNEKVIQQDLSRNYELPAIERLEKSPFTYKWRNVVTPLVLPYLDRSFLSL